MTEIEALRDAIRRYDYAYYVLSEPLISDEGYDALVQRLKKLEAEPGAVLDPYSPTQRLSAVLGEHHRLVRHVVPMLSLDNVFSVAEVLRWADRTGADAWVVEPKIDGVAISIQYEQRRLFRALTRGDGEVGEDVTLAVRTIRSVPLRLPEGAPDWVEVRGEVYMNRDDFSALNRTLELEGDKPFANPRNLASGSLRQLDVSVTRARPLRWCAYQWVQAEEYVGTHWEALEQLRAWLFPVNPQAFRARREDLAELSALDARRHAQAYEIDGWVIKVNDLRQQTGLANTRRAPRWAIALKPESQKVVTLLQSVSFQVGRSGVLTPVGSVVPVSMGGVVVRSMSLYNLDELDRLGVCIGDWVWVTRAGEVIPKCMGVCEPGPERTPIVLPTACPSCGGDLRVDDGVLRCDQALSCPDQVCARIEHFVSREALDIDGIGPKLVRELYERVGLRFGGELFELSLDQWQQCERMGIKRAENLRTSLEKARHTECWRALVALGIEHVGEGNARTLASQIERLSDLFAFDEAALVRLPGIGPINAQSIVRYCASSVHRSHMTQLDRHLCYRESEDRKGPLTGWVVVMTGRLSVPRSSMAVWLEQQGARVVGSLNAEVTHCLVGSDPGRTSVEAAQRSIALISEDEVRHVVVSAQI